MGFHLLGTGVNFKSPVPIPYGTPYIPFVFTVKTPVYDKREIERHVNAVMFTMYFSFRLLKDVSGMFDKSFSKKERECYPDVIECRNNINAALNTFKDIYDDLMFQCDGESGQKRVSSTLSYSYDVAKVTIDKMLLAFKDATFGDKKNKRADITSTLFMARAICYMSIVYIKNTTSKFSNRYKYLKEKIYVNEIHKAFDYIDKAEEFVSSQVRYKDKGKADLVEKYQIELCNLISDVNFYPKIAEALGYTA